MSPPAAVEPSRAATGQRNLLQGQVTTESVEAGAAPMPLVDRRVRSAKLATTGAIIAAAVAGSLGVGSVVLLPLGIGGLVFGTGALIAMDLVVLITVPISAVQASFARDEDAPGSPAFRTTAWLAYAATVPLTALGFMTSASVVSQSPWLPMAVSGLGVAAGTLSLALFAADAALTAKQIGERSSTESAARGRSSADLLAIPVMGGVFDLDHRFVPTVGLAGRL